MEKVLNEERRTREVAERMAGNIFCMEAFGENSRKKREIPLDKTFKAV